MAIIDQLEPLFTEIAELLGELAGNEAAWRLFDAEDARELTDGWTREPGYFTIPGRYGFETPAMYVAMHPSHPDWDNQTVTNADRERILQDAITDTWNQAKDRWTLGAASTMFRIQTRNVWEPDPEPMAASAESLGRLTRWLEQQTYARAGWGRPGAPDTPQWLTNLEQHWPQTSEASSSFFEFWDDVNDKCSLYLHAAARLTAASCAATATVADFQTNLLEVTGLTRDRAREALQQWQAWKDDDGAWPTGAMEDNPAPTILADISYATGALSLFSMASVVTAPASVPLGVVSLVTGGLSYIIPEQTIAMEALTAATADGIYDGFTTDLRLVEKNMGNALDALRVEAPDDPFATTSQGLQTFAAEVVASHQDWAPLPVNL